MAIRIDAPFVGFSTIEILPPSLLSIKKANFRRERISNLFFFTDFNDFLLDYSGRRITCDEKTSIIALDSIPESLISLGNKKAVRVNDNLAKWKDTPRLLNVTWELWVQKRFSPHQMNGSDCAEQFSHPLHIGNKTLQVPHSRRVVQITEMATTLAL
jgi:hypothetical protein